MIRRVPLNIFQRLMRRWDAIHPYNAAQVMKINGQPDPSLIQSAWQATLLATGLGSVKVEKDSYHYESLNGHAAAYSVAQPKLSLEDHVTAEMNRAFDDPGEPPFRPFIITEADHFYAGVVYQHWLADSASVRLLAREWFVRMYDPRVARVTPLSLARHGYWNTIGPSRSGWGLTESILDMTRRHIRLRRVQKIDSSALSNFDTRFRLFTAAPGLIDRVRAAATRRHVKVNDVFLAALVEASARHVPLQRRPKRSDVAVGSVVDLRPYCPDDLSDTFGLFLGFTNVIAQQYELKNFDTLLGVVARQTRCQKQTGVAPASLMWMSAAMIVGTLSKPGELYHFYRKELPLAGGISNVNLSHTWAADYPGVLLDYIRISPTGPMTPLVITTTTLGDQFHLGLTYRTGLISPGCAAAVAEMFLHRLQSIS